MARRTYDVKCYELAEHFLQDHVAINTINHCRHLAGDIQEAIETYLEWAEKQEGGKT